MSSYTRPGAFRGTRQALAVAASLLAASQAAAGGLTVTVPGDYATIQEAVDAVQSNASPGEVVVESDGVFEETVVINESVTLRAGAGFSPTIEQVGASVGPLRLFGDPDDETEVLVEGLTLRLVDSGSAAAVSIRNVSDSERLEVRLEEVVIEVENAGFGVRAESGNGGTVGLVIIESTIEIVGAQVGSPSCMRLGGVGYDLNAFIAGNRFRFSDAGGLVLLGGGNTDEKGYFVLANVFESFASAVGEGRIGVQVQGVATPMTNLSSADVSLLSNLFIANERAIRAFSSFEHEFLLVATNNTIVDTRFNAVEIGAVADSAITAGLANNVIAGTTGIPGEGGGFGVIAEVSDQGVIDLVHGHNLLFDNAAGDYGGIAMPGPGDLFADPLFVAPAGGDYRLLASSPAVDAGDNEPAPPAAWGRSTSRSGRGSSTATSMASRSSTSAPMSGRPSRWRCRPCRPRRSSPSPACSRRRRRGGSGGGRPERTRGAARSPGERISCRLSCCLMRPGFPHGMEAATGGR